MVEDPSVPVSTTLASHASRGKDDRGFRPPGKPIPQ